MLLLLSFNFSVLKFIFGWVAISGFSSRLAFLMNDGIERALLPHGIRWRSDPSSNVAFKKMISFFRMPDLVSIDMILVH